jgi:hypothetical protein
LNRILLSETVTYKDLRITCLGQLMLTVSILAVVGAVIVMAISAPQYLAGVGVGGGIYGVARRLRKKFPG